MLHRSFAQPFPSGDGRLGFTSLAGQFLVGVLRALLCLPVVTFLTSAGAEKLITKSVLGVQLAVDARNLFTGDAHSFLGGCGNLQRLEARSSRHMLLCRNPSSTVGILPARGRLVITRVGAVCQALRRLLCRLGLAKLCFKRGDKNLVIGQSSRCLGPAERLGICADVFQCIDGGIEALSLAPQLIDAQGQARELIVFKRPTSKNREILVDDLRSGRYPCHLDLRREGRLVISLNRLQTIDVVRRIQEERLGKQAAQPIDGRTQSS